MATNFRVGAPGLTKPLSTHPKVGKAVEAAVQLTERTQGWLLVRENQAWHDGTLHLRRDGTVIVYKFEQPLLNAKLGEPEWMAEAKTVLKGLRDVRMA